MSERQALAIPIDTTPDSIEHVLDVVGGKGKSLMILANGGISVPSGFIITTQAYNDFVEANHLEADILAIIAGIKDQQTTLIESASAEIQDLILKSSTPLDTVRVIREAYRGLGDTIAVAVRSSATAEDLPELSFAGQQDTYLNIVGEKALLDAVRRCWSSLWTQRAISYRLKQGIDQSVMSMAVVVQSMVQAEVSGILFTANPISGDRKEIIVNASFGLGEAIVSGQVTPDNYVLDRENLKIKEKAIASKNEMVIAAGEIGVETQPVSEENREVSSLETKTLVDLARLSLDAERLFEGVPQDIEWAVYGRRVYILQSRPITHLPPEPLAEVRWEPDYKGGKLIRRQVVENMPDPLSTLFSELYLEVGLEYSMDHMIETVGIPIDIEDLITRPFFVTVNGYAYCRADYKIPFRKIFRIIGWYAKMAPSFARNIVPRWKQEALPEYLSTIGRWKAVDSEMISDEELLSGIRELSVADAVYWFSVAMVMGIAKMTDGALHLFLTRLVKGNLISGMFLRGFPSKTLEAQVDLESIAKRIQTSRSLRDLVIATPAIQMIEILENDPTAALIAADLNDYLEKYGHQIYTLDFVQKTQGENPLPILMSLKSLVEDDRDDTNAIQAEISRDRKILEQQTLDSVGPVRRWIFRKLLRWAQTFGPNREEALFYVGGAWPTLRELAHELGNRLVAAGMLQKPEDIYYLKSAEISSACQARAEMKEMTDLLEIVDARIRLRESQSRLHPPPMVPEGRFKIGPIDMSFIETQKRNKDDSNVLNGFAVSPGRVTGEASVIMSPADFIQMKPDTILVCPTTTPAWTALFPQALALVTDIGGILAHGSIVAREFGIPAVMGTGNITERIVSGQRITVDGEAGTVTIASD